jgi:hypothetical protein
MRPDRRPTLAALHDGAGCVSERHRGHGWLGDAARSIRAGSRFPVHTHEQPEFLFILEGELVQAGRRLGPGWASVASPGSVDADVYSEAGCVFLLVDRA